MQGMLLAGGGGGGEWHEGGGGWEAHFSLYSFLPFNFSLRINKI